jgi:hypothetical protein
MDLYSIIIENKLALELVYALAICLICAVIVIKTDKFFRLSMHNGIRYFRNAFFFYGIAFIARYIFGVLYDLDFNFLYIAKIIFEYFLIMAGFFLLYSLIWRKLESSKEEYFSSLFNAKIAVFHAMALIIAVMDSLWTTYDFMFFSQIIIFFYVSVISYINYKNDKKGHKFPKFYFVAMLISLSFWILNFLAEAYFEWNHNILIDIGIINIIFFLLFLYGVIKVTKIK